MDTYVSLYHLRNTNNQNWPLWKSFEVLEDWLKNEATVFESMMEHGANCQTVRSTSTIAALSSPTTLWASSIARQEAPPAATCTPVRKVHWAITAPTTPPIRRPNPRNPLEETYIVNATGATPKRGTSAHPKGPLLEAQREFVERYKQCDGTQYYKLHVPDGSNRSKYKKPCFLCGTETLWICAVCKRPACEVNRDEKLRKLINKLDKKVAFLNGDRPAATIKIESRNNDGTLSTFCTVVNSCHRILHRDSNSSS